MTREELIRNLKYTMEKHKNDKLFTFDTNISVMCKDILDYLEQEPYEDAISRQVVKKRTETHECVSLCDDAISRQAVIDGINEYFHDEYYQRTSIQDCRDCLIEDVIKYLPSVTPQHMDAEIQKMQELEQAEIQKAYELGKEDKIKVLNKIRSEIAGLDNAIYGFEGYYMAVTEALEIIDKYRSESEVKDESI